MERFPISCNKDCGAGCALEAHIENGLLLKVTDNSERLPYMQGCVKGYRMPEILYHEDRLTTPLKRVGRRGEDQFIPISWEIAYTEIVERLGTVDAAQIMRLGGSGSCRGALHNTDTLTSRFLAMMGDFTDTLGTYSSQVVDFINPYIFGTKTVGIDIRTVLHSKAIILWGYNPFDTRFGCESESVFREVKKRGIPCFVIDPRETKSVSLCGGEWVGIRPGTDSYLAAALGYLCIQRFPDRLQSLDSVCEGHKDIADYLLGKVDGVSKTPELASARCGISLQMIDQIFEALTADIPAAILPGLSVQRVMGGENLQRLLIFLQLMAGNGGTCGGSIGGGQWNKVPKVRYGSMTAPATCNGVPVYRWADAVLQGTSGGYPTDIKVIYNVGGNYLLQSSDTTKVKDAFGKVDFVVTHEMFMTPTCRYSDIILPVAMFPEREDLCSSNSGFLFYSQKVIEPPVGVKTDYQIFCDLSSRLGFKEDFDEGKSESQWIQQFLDESEIDDIDHFKRKGFFASPKRGFVAFTDFFKEPETHRLTTPSGKIELVSEHLDSAGIDHYPLLQDLFTSKEYPLTMVTPHARYRIHSQNVQIPSLQGMVDDTIWMHLDDARCRGIEHGDSVRVISPVGCFEGIVSLDSQIIRGAICKLEGFWDPQDTRDQDCNMLTSDIPTMPSYGSRTHTIAVEVTKVL